MSILVPVTHDRVDQHWRTIAPMLAPAVDRSLGNYNLMDVYLALKNRDMQLWLSKDGDKIEAAGVTRIDIHERFRSCAIPFIGGENRDNWLPFEEKITDWAKTLGCSALDGFFREGWKRVLKDQGWVLGYTFARKWL